MDRRDQILEAALACFSRAGYERTTIADIRRQSDATTGSIYHFFDGKAALAAALLDRATSGWTAAGPDAARTDAGIAAAIRASVAGLVDWGLANPGLFRFLDEIRVLAFHDPDLAAVRDRLLAGQQAARAAYEAGVADGEVRSLPWAVAHALMLGPAYDFLRRGETPDPRAATLLADAAWNAVRAR